MTSEQDRAKAAQAMEATDQAGLTIQDQALISIAYSLASISKDLAYLRDRTTPFNTGPG